MIPIVIGEFGICASSFGVHLIQFIAAHCRVGRSSQRLSVASSLGVQLRRATSVTSYKHKQRSSFVETMSSSESIYSWIKAAPVVPEKAPLHRSAHAPLAAPSASTFRETMVKKPTGTMGRVVKHTVRPDGFLKSGALANTAAKTALRTCFHVLFYNNAAVSFASTVLFRSGGFYSEARAY